MSNNRISAETQAKIAAVWNDMLERYAAAQTLDQICKAYSLTRGQIRGYRETVPNARQEWNDARKESAQAYLDQLVEVTNNTDLDPRRARVMIDSLRFLIERLDPDSFSPRTRAEITHKVIDLNQAIRDANLRLAAARQPLLERDVTHEGMTLGLPALTESVFANLL